MAETAFDLQTATPVIAIFLMSHRSLGNHLMFISIRSNMQMKDGKFFKQKEENKMERNNTVILNEVIVGLYSNKELDLMLNKLSNYYQVAIADFTVNKVNPNSYKEMIT